MQSILFPVKYRKEDVVDPTVIGMLSQETV